MAQQTAVKWLINYVTKEDGVFTKGYILRLLEQAKAMEKEQISKAWDAGKHQFFSLGIPDIKFNNGDEYYDINYNESITNKN